MGIAYRVDPDAGFTVFVWHGAVTFQHTIDHVLQLAADPQWPPGLLQLTDLRTVTRVTLPDPQLLNLVLDGSPWREEDFEKVVVVRDHVLRGTIVQDAAASVGMNAKVFGELDAACTHLGVDAASVATTIAELRVEVERAINRVENL